MPTFATPPITDQLALELLNSLPMEQGAAVDYLGSDELAAAWILRATGAADTSSTSVPKGLGKKARELRSCIRELVETCKAGRRQSLDGLNQWLSQMPSHLEIRQQHGETIMQRMQQGSPAMQWLSPFGEAAAELLVGGDFTLVRRCENTECVLWFYDRTKAHKRRWCSMASCGNRHKVSQFRSRQQA